MSRDEELITDIEKAMKAALAEGVDEDWIQDVVYAVCYGAD